MRRDGCTEFDFQLEWDAPAKIWCRDKDAQLNNYFICSDSTS
jgi:hypothetical protein